jgi:hypothetical protein
MPKVQIHALGPAQIGLVNLAAALQKLGSLALDFV